MKFTDEELSRVLSAHEGGQLKREGEPWTGTPLFGMDYKACAMQAAFVDPHSSVFERDEIFADEFDHAYAPEWTTEQFLAWLESQGVA